MTDKVQKIREEVERYKKLIGDPLFNDNDLIIGERNAINHVLKLIDSLPEEPKFSVGDKIRRKDDHDMTIEIKELKDGCYVEGGEFYVRFSEQDDWELVEESVSKVWHDSNKEQPNFASGVAIWNPKYKNGEIISRCTEVYSDRIWAYIDDLLKI